MVDSERIRDLIDQATAATEGMDEPLRTAAFQTLLQWLLANSPTGGSPAARPEAAGSAARASSPPPTANEFLASLAVGSHLDRIAAILYYNLHYASSDRMTREELLETYGRLRERRPANLSDILAKAIRRGHVIDAAEAKDGRRAWQVTPTGERYVEGLRAAE